MGRARRAFGLVGALALAMVGCAVPSPGGVESASSARVLRIVDGDTIEVRRRGRSVTVRLLGVDSPESKHPRRPVECGAREATGSLLRLLFSAPRDTDGDSVVDTAGGRGRRVRLEFDESQSRRDRYGRELAYVRLPGGRLVQGVQLRRGWAEVYVFRRPFRLLRRFRARERWAEERRAGVWGMCGGDFHRPAE